ncbi:MAG: hypothetical protein B7Z55_11310 [Planctomycetales bacterium 12-60-4]|nr:MAG: hypothetical protein B7Z55_11310 [Planctomycetales bacterium 12-60-4]
MPRNRHWILITFRFGRAWRVRMTGRMLLVPLLVLGLPVSYCLSVGPVVWVLHTYGLESHPAVEYLAYYYLPLIWCAEHSEVFEAVMVWYQELWVS